MRWWVARAGPSALPRSAASGHDRAMRPHNVRSVVPALVVAALALAACGGGSDSGGSKEKGSTTVAAADGGEEQVLAEIGSILAVRNGPTEASMVELPDARVTKIVTYHWNDATGAPPGTVALEGPDGTTYGPFETEGSDGQGGVPNAYWTASVDIEVPAGTYQVIDSDPATWAWNDETGGRGMVTIIGIPD